MQFKPRLDSIESVIEQSSQQWRAALSLKPGVLKTESGKDFAISDEFTTQLKDSVLTLKPTKASTKTEEVRHKQAGIDKASVEAKPKAKVVECECVHGTCKEGQATCNKCDSGWTGLLCDQPTKKTKTTKVIDEDEEAVFSVQKI